MGLKIAVLAGGTFEPERSVVAANDVIAALKEAEHEPELVMVDGGLVDTLSRSQPDVAINCLRGADGESGDIQGALEAANVPCVGSSAAVCRRAYDKAGLAEALQAYHNLTEDVTTAVTAQSLTLSRRAFGAWGAEAVLSQVESRISSGYPLCVKPASASAAQGVRRVENAEQLSEALHEALKLADRALVQQWVEGVEISVCILGSGWDAHALPPVEIVPRKGLYLTDARLGSHAVDFHAPIRLESLSQDEATAQAIRSEIERAALEVYRAFAMEGYGRVDLIWDGAQTQVLEVDVAPSLAERSLFSAACEAAGLSVPAVLDRLVEG